MFKYIEINIEERTRSTYYKKFDNIIDSSNYVNKYVYISNFFIDILMGNTNSINFNIDKSIGLITLYEKMKFHNLDKIITIYINTDNFVYYVEISNNISLMFCFYKKNLIFSNDFILKSEFNTYLSIITFIIYLKNEEKICELIHSFIRVKQVTGAIENLNSFDVSFYRKDDKEISVTFEILHRKFFHYKLMYI